MFLSLSNICINETCHGKIAVIAYMSTAKVKASVRGIYAMSVRLRAVSPEPVLFAHLSGRRRGNFSLRTRPVALLRDQEAH